MYDVVIIGAGPAGLMAAATIENKKVILLEKNEVVGKKLLATGNGRCNVTNMKETNDLMKEYNNPKFLYSTFNKFNPYDIVYFFESRGLQLKEEDNNRMFPITNKSSDIVSVLVNECKRKNVEIRLDQNVEIKINDNKFDVFSNGKKIVTKKLIVATGGNTYHNLGTTGDAYKWLEKTHTITKIYPTESALVSSDKVIISKELQGVNIKGSKIKLNKKVIEENYDILFTHFGLSGPLAFRISEVVYKELKASKQVQINIDLVPDLTEEELKNMLSNLNGKIKVSNAFKGKITKRLFEYVTKELNISEKNVADLSKKDINNLISYLKDFLINICDVKGLNHAFVTGGGVSTKDINPNSFESKRIKDLYIIGEVLDIHAHTGGYNVTAALSMGYSAAVAINKD